MAQSSDHADEEVVRAPIGEEVLSVGKQPVVTGILTVTSTVTSDRVAVREDLTGTSVRIERVAIGRFVDDVPVTRTEGERTIVPVVEEVVVKRLRLIEEVHLIRETHTEPFEQSIALRRLDVTIERSPPAPE